MLRGSSIVIGLALIVFSAWVLWMAGSFEYRHAYYSAAFGVALLGLARYSGDDRSSSWPPLAVSAAIAAVGIAWGLDGAIEELRPAILYGDLNLRVNSIVETVTVVLLSTHLLLNVMSSIRVSRRVAPRSRPSPARTN